MLSIHDIGPMVCLFLEYDPFISGATEAKGNTGTLLKKWNKICCVCVPPKKSIAANSTGSDKKKKRSSPHADMGLSPLSGFFRRLMLPCRLQEDNHRSTLRENLLFHGFSHLFPHVSKSHHSCLCLCCCSHTAVAEISVVIPPAKDSYLALVS